SIFKPKSSSGEEEAGFIRFLYFGDNPNQRKKPKMTAVADDRTNSVVVTAPTEMLKVIEDVIHELDSDPAQQESLFIYHLNNAQQQGQQPNQPFDPNAQQQQQGNRGRANNNNNNNANNRSSNSGNRRSSRSSRSGRNRGNMPQLSQGLFKAINELTGEVFVV